MHAGHLRRDREAIVRDFNARQVRKHEKAVQAKEERRQQRLGIVLEAARRAWYGHGPAGNFFFASGTILLKSIVEEGCDRVRSNERRARAAAAAACARAPRARRARAP